ncbi:MAG TPA: DUF494 family protein [Candidatus Eisenbacteria bacterium]|nr:DUF494 family protein [Candidatus Eisenbacteria bacterium]
MSDQGDREAVQRLLGVLARHLEDFFEGDELALESLGAALEDSEFTADQIQSAVLTLKSLAGSRSAAAQAPADPPGRSAQRVLSDQERGSMSPEAWGYLLDLRRRGSLDAGQFECVLDRLAASGVRPIGVEMAHDMAVRVAFGAGAVTDGSLGESDVAH